MKLVIGDHVVGDALLLKPVDQMKIRRELMRRIETAAAMIRPEGRQHRTQHRHMRHAASIIVPIVGAPQAVFFEIGIFIRVELRILKRRHAAQLLKACNRFVSIGDIAERRQKHRYLRRRFSFWRANDEGKVVPRSVLSRQLERIDAALEVTRRGESEILFPASVFKIVVMEVNGLVLFRRFEITMDMTCPFRAVNSPERPIDDKPFKSTPCAVRNFLARRVERKVPIGDQLRFWRAALEERIDIVAGKRASEKLRLTNLAVKAVKRALS